MPAPHDSAHFVCLCRRCVKADPDTFLRVAYCRGRSAPIGAAGTRRELRDRLRPTGPVRAQRDVADSLKFGFGSGAPTPKPPHDRQSSE